ncbi:serine/threonine-protein kinase [Allokutzneria albata]|uniref:non-specific serine/threonine protein kinase n=1 Tax=Allokutzneria albata TaxID=211114 RepID=A0A1G9RID1_ALLAB|nr:serine/threonine-protein kinase [Allokutzneria albata]SDM22810.1 Serine/threonine protein kinase [Allokutzneria albata]
MTSTEAGDDQGRLLGGRYRLGELIGRGGMGSVWSAVDEMLRRDVAVKEVTAPAWVSDEERRSLADRTMREARAAARISHPNVVTVYDVVDEDGRPWIVMELVRAPSLAQVVERDGALAPSRVAAIALQVFAALSAAHEHGILHRDVKPGNVLVHDTGRTVLTDFGIATVQGDASLTVSGMLVGAPGYIAPERARGLEVGTASDLWSLAATMYAAVEGKPPFDRTGALPTLTAVLTEDPEPMRNAGPLRPLIEAMLRKEPEERPSPAEVESVLRRVALGDLGEDEAATVLVSSGVGAGATASLVKGEPTRVQPALKAAAAAAQPWYQRTPAKVGAGLGVAILTAGTALAIALLINQPDPIDPGGDGGAGNSPSQVPPSAPLVSGEETTTSRRGRPQTTTPSTSHSTTSWQPSTTSQPPPPTTTPSKPSTTKPTTQPSSPSTPPDPGGVDIGGLRQH